MDKLSSYRIGDFTFSLKYPDSFVINKNFSLFETDTTEDPDYYYKILLRDSLDKPEGNLIVSRNNIRIFQNGPLENRELLQEGSDLPYACYRETDDTHAEIIFRKELLSNLIYDPFFLSLLAMERRMLDHNGLILHCAYLDSKENGAILFSAPSGTGKSTQAGLWEKYRPGTRQINGDKALLQKMDGMWTARSWPVCGSSEICRLQDTKIRAIVMLSQEPVNTCERLSAMKAFSLIYPQITCNRWNKEAQMKTMDLIEDLIRYVPVYHFGCTISEEAVDVLERSLSEKGKSK